MRVFLVDGTYELFRHYYGVPPHRTAEGAEVGATRGVLSSMLRLLEQGVTHLGVATDHVIESFRNYLWAGYKSSAGLDPRLLGQFGLVEVALEAMGVVVWPMVEVEADDALASAAAVAAAGQWVVAVRNRPALAATLRELRPLAMLFKDLATLRVDPSLLEDAAALRWTGPTPLFAEVCERIDARPLAARAAQLAAGR